MMDADIADDLANLSDASISSPSDSLKMLLSKEVSKKIDVNFQVNQLKRFILFGCSSHYRSATRRSINLWFSSEINVRLYKGDCKIKCLKFLSTVLEEIKGTEDEINAKRLDITNKIVKVFTDNQRKAPLGVIPFLLTRMTKHCPLRPIVAKLFPLVIEGSFDLLLFCYYTKKVKGNQHIIRSAMIEWFKEHSSTVELVKDLLLVKSRVGWCHKDVIFRWSIPVTDNDVILKILMGLPYDLDKIKDDEMREVVKKCLTLRDLNNRSSFLKIVNDADYQKWFGLDLVSHIKNQIINVEVCLLMIERQPINMVIESIPRMLLKFPSSEPLVNSLYKKIMNFRTPQNPTVRPKLNKLSAFIVMKWLEYQDDEKKKSPKVKKNPKVQKVSFKQVSKALEELIDDESFQFSDQILFILNIPDNDDDEAVTSGTNISKKSTMQDINRPTLCPNVIKPIEFVYFLLHLYPNNRILFRDKYYNLTDANGKRLSKLQEVKTFLDRIRKSQAKSIGPYQGTFKKAIYITFDGSVNVGEESPMKVHKIDKTVVVSVRDKALTSSKGTPHHRSIFTIQGLDHNYLSHIERYFTSV